MTTMLIADQHLIELTHNDSGKYLCPGDMVIADGIYYKVESKTYDSSKDEWLLVVSDMYVRVKDDRVAYYNYTREGGERDDI